MRYFFLFLLFTSCHITSTPAPKQTVRLNLSTEPYSLDPRLARDLTSCTLIHMLFEGLTRTSKEGAAELALAESVEVADNGKTLIFHLRDSKWSNGDLVTSAHFAMSWKTILDPQFPSDTAYQLFVLKNGKKVKQGELPLEALGIQTPDSHTLLVELETPLPYFLELFSLPVFSPVHENSAVCNGPFKLREWKRADSLIFEKNPLYWQADEVKLQEIVSCLASADTGIRMFQEGKLDWTGSPLATIPPDAIREYKSEGILSIQPFSGTAFLRVNITDPILSQREVRRALALSIDRSSIAEHLLQGGQRAALELVPPEMGLTETGYFADADSEAARALLGEKKEAITLSFMAGDRNSLIAQALQQQWEKNLGIQVALEAVEPKIYFQRVSRKEYQLALGSWTADFNDPINFLEVFKYRDSGTNNTGWENQTYIDLLERSSLCREAEERKACLRAAETLLIEEMPIIPVYHFVLNFLVNDALKDIALSPIGGLDFRWAYWEE